MKAVLIDPTARTVTDVDVSPELDDIYETLRCSSIAPIPLPESDCMYVDDEGMLKLDDETRFFVLLNPGYQPTHLVAGKAIIFGLDFGGDIIPPHVDASIMQSFIRFVNDSPAACRVADRIVNLTGVIESMEQWESTQQQYSSLMREAMLLT